MKFLNISSKNSFLVRLVVMLLKDEANKNFLLNLYCFWDICVKSRKKKTDFTLQNMSTNI